MVVCLCNTHKALGPIVGTQLKSSFCVPGSIEWEPPIKRVSPEDLTFNREESCAKPCLPWKELARASSLDQLERDDFLETAPELVG